MRIQRPELAPTSGFAHSRGLSRLPVEQLLFTQSVPEVRRLAPPCAGCIIDWLVEEIKKVLSEQLNSTEKALLEWVQLQQLSFVFVSIVEQTFPALIPLFANSALKSQVVVQNKAVRGARSRLPAALYSLLGTCPSLPVGQVL